MYPSIEWDKEADAQYTVLWSCCNRGIIATRGRKQRCVNYMREDKGLVMSGDEMRT
jgi:hypothetical protein